jgi:hypothetical protein
MKHGAVVLMIACAAAFPARAGDIYVWTDESGKTHLADSVPARYRKAAVRIDSSQFELTPEQQREAAAARAALEKKADAVAAPFVNANGSLKPGAFAACKSVVNPTLQCGSPKAY